MPSIKPVGGKVQLEVERLDEGLDTTAGPNQVDIHGSPDCLNVVFDQFGSVQTRFGCTQVNTQAIGLAPIDGQASYNGSHIAWAGGDMYRRSGTTWVTIPSAQSQFASGANVASEVYQQVLFLSDGTNGPYRYEDQGDFYRMGIAIPSAPTASSLNATAATAGPQPGDYHYKVSYLNTHLVEGQVGSHSVTCTLTNTSTVSITCMPTAAPVSHGVAFKFIYRCGPNSGPSGTYRFVGSVAAGTNAFVDSVGTATFNVGATPVTDGTAPTPFTTIKLHKDRLFFDDSSNRTILRYTNFRTPYISAAANFINLNKGDFSNITALGVQDDLLTAFRTKDIWVVSLTSPGDDTSWTFFKTPGNIGIVGPNALAEVQNAILFVGQRNGKISGFHLLSGIELTQTRDTRLRSDRVSNRIESDILLFPSALWSKIAMVHHNNQVFTSVAKSGDTSNKHIYWLDATRISDSGEIGSWSLWDGRSSQMNNFVVHNGTLFGGSSQADGLVFEMNKTDQYNDNGAAINSYWWSKQLGGEESIESWIKDFRFINLWYYKLGAWMMKVNFRVDQDTSDGNYVNVDLTPGGALYGTGTYGVSVYGGGPADAEIQKSFGSLLGRRIQVRFSNNNTVNTAFRVHAFKVLMNLRRQIREAT